MMVDRRSKRQREIALEERAAAVVAELRLATAALRRTLERAEKALREEEDDGRPAR